MEALKQTDPEIHRLLLAEADRQSNQLEMIASENFVSEAVMQAMGSVLTNKYAESEAGFLLNPNRFNVAVTRARSKLILLVSEEVLDAVPSDEEVMSGSMALKGYGAHCAHGSAGTTLSGPDGAPVELRCRYRALGD